MVQLGGLSGCGLKESVRKGAFTAGSHAGKAVEGKPNFWEIVADGYLMDGATRDHALLFTLTLAGKAKTPEVAVC